MKKRLTKKEFKIKSERVHGKLYNYELVEYINAHTKVKIICKKHGTFEQRPCNHLKGKGCGKCINIGLNLEERIKTFKGVHKDVYSYDKVIYKSNKIPIIITCSKHGDFKQTPSVHLLGSGCQKCAMENRKSYIENNPTGWKLENWIELSKNSKYFDSFKVYVLKVFNNKESFYKIGRTFNTLTRRFMGIKNMPYEYEVLKIFTGSAEEMFDLENELKQKNKEHKYLPDLKFNGRFECFIKIESI